MVQFIDEVIAGTENGAACRITGRVTRVHKNGKIVFFDLTDASETVQVVASKKDVDNFDIFKNLTIGSYVAFEGELGHHQGQEELRAQRVEVLGESRLHLSPHPWSINGLEEQHRGQVIGQPDFYLSNPQRMAVLKVVEAFNYGLSEYFRQNRFTRVTPPILTGRVLYSEDNSIDAQVHGEDVYLSQCATFELEPLALAFKKVFTISPAFRNEKGGSKRHLAEYTHAKAEIMEADYQDLMRMASVSIHHAITHIANHAERWLDILGVDINPDAIHLDNLEYMTYQDALKVVQAQGSETVFGKGLTSADEKMLTGHVGNKYLWVMFNPCEAEGFPYRRHDEDPRLSMTCDLIAPHGAGEMVGIAEKILETGELIEKMLEKVLGDMVLDYRDYLASRLFGMPPHGGMGAAPERIVYGLLGLDHIMYTKSHPRYPDRRIRTTGSMNPWKNPELEDLFARYGLLDKPVPN